VPQANEKSISATSLFTYCIHESMVVNMLCADEGASSLRGKDFGRGMAEEGFSGDMNT